MNLIVLSGNITRDVEERFTKNSNVLYKFSMAVNRKVGEKEYPTFFNCIFWGENLDLKNAMKGTSIKIMGRMENNRYEKDGEWKDYWQVVVESLVTYKKKNPEFKEQSEIKFKKSENVASFRDDDIPF